MLKNEIQIHDYVFFSPQAQLCQYHHWREGNLPGNSKCLVCKKTCWSAECLAGMRCEWCGVTVSVKHGGCAVRSKGMFTWDATGSAIVTWHVAERFAAWQNVYMEGSCCAWLLHTVHVSAVSGVCLSKKNARDSLCWAAIFNFKTKLIPGFTAVE